jgi:multiple sugar transport system substrate-binding protein
MRSRFFALVAALVTGPIGAQGADLVVWWDEGYYAEEADAIAEVIDAFEHKTGKQVELVLYPQEDLPGQIAAALEEGRPPDFAFGIDTGQAISRWAFDDQLVDLSDAVGHFSDLFDPSALAWAMLLNGKTGQRALYALPVGRSTNHLHVWNSLLQDAGFTLDDIPREWNAFWSFWCDQVQPAIRQAMRRDDVWGVGLNMSGEPAETWAQFLQFVAAYDADYVTPDGRLVIDEPEVRQNLVRAMAAYTAPYRKGCVPPDAISWVTGAFNNERFLGQAIVMTPNETLSIPNALKAARPSDYRRNVATIEWPLSPTGKPFAIWGFVFSAVVFKGGTHVATAEAFVRFLVREAWLAHYLNFAGERLIPAMPKLLEQPFWLDPNDPHRMAAVMQVATRPAVYSYAVASGDWRHDQVLTENVWSKAVHRVAAEGVSPEQAVDEAIARIKEILSE